MSWAAASARQDRPRVNPGTGKAYGLDLPVITIRDMVRAQAMLIDHLGIDTLFCVAGGSMGGMQVLQWAALYPDRVFSAMPIATGSRHSSQNIAFHEVGRQAVMADPDWCQGRYLDAGTRPEKGLSVARMAAHVTYLSDQALHAKFGRKLQDREAPTFSFDADFQIESYLRYQGRAFVERFDANSYLYMTRAMDYFDLAADYGGQLAKAFRGTKARFCVVSFTSDWLFPTSESRAIVHALNAGGASVSFVEIETDKGHDAFLLDLPDLVATSRGFLESAARARGCRTGSPTRRRTGRTSRSRHGHEGRGSGQRDRPDGRASAAAVARCRQTQRPSARRRHGGAGKPGARPRLRRRDAAAASWPTRWRSMRAAWNCRSAASTIASPRVCR